VVVNLLVAASLHLLLIGEHAQESALLATGFLGAGVLQVGLASLILANPGRHLYYAVVGLNLILILLYVVHIFAGLPDVISTRGLIFGPPEGVDLAGVLTKVAELVSGLAALRLAAAE